MYLLNDEGKMIGLEENRRSGTWIDRGAAFVKNNAVDPALK